MPVPEIYLTVVLIGFVFPSAVRCRSIRISAVHTFSTTDGKVTRQPQDSIRRHQAFGASNFVHYSDELGASCLIRKPICWTLANFCFRVSTWYRHTLQRVLVYSSLIPVRRRRRKSLCRVPSPELVLPSPHAPPSFSSYSAHFNSALAHMCFLH